MGNRPDTNPDPVKLLSDDEVAEIEARLKVRNEARDLYRDVVRLDSGEADRLIKIMHQWEEHEAPVDVPALCATVRALRAELERVPLAQSALRQLDELQTANRRALAENTALREQLSGTQETLRSIRDCKNEKCGQCAALLYYELEQDK